MQRSASENGVAGGGGGTTTITPEEKVRQVPTPPDTLGDHDQPHVAAYDAV